MWLHICEGGDERLDKPVTTVGVGQGCDVQLDSLADGTWFSLRREGDAVEVLPGEESVRVNGKRVSGSRLLLDGDRLEAGNQAFLFLRNPIKSGDGKEVLASKCLELLSGLAAGIGRGADVALEDTLEALVELAGAESGHLVVESERSGGWAIAASVGTEGTGRKELLSNTVLREAIACRRAVHVESIVGHPWAANASLLGTRIFSIACLPLFVSGRCFGCVYLYTRTPGKSIQRERLDDLAVLATQAALLLASESRAGRSRGRAPEAPKLSFSEGPMQALEERLGKLAPSDLNLLVVGETGTGKELIARAIHGRSRRASGPFVAVNCGALPPTLIESVLFGYQKGAFTGADRDTKGKFAAADGGTLFLDEIGDLPLDLQVKLLRALQERQIEPLGATRPVSVDLRVVAATHRDLKGLVRDGKFREDLFYRLAGAALEVPPLRERAGDILPLAKLFLARAGEGFALSEGAIERLVAHRWPGNVRELEQVIARAAALASGQTVEVGDLEIQETESPMATEFRQARGAYSIELVQRALARMGGSRSRAAAALGISERTLYRILASDIEGSSV